MHLSFKLQGFRCEKKIQPFLEHVLTGEYDIPLSFRHKATILDLGANVGAFSIWATHRWPGCEVYAYEPHPDNVAVLVKNLRAYPNVRVHPVGVGNPGIRPLFTGKHNCGEHSFHTVKNNPAPIGQHIEVIDPLTLPEADILKMDIEGCEIEVLPKLLGAGRIYGAVLFEYHNEEIRRELDLMLKDYVLVGSEIYTPERGTVKYMRKGLLP